MDQVALAAQEAIDAVGQIASDLPDPRVVRMADQTGNMHTAGLEVDDEPDDVADETAEREGLDGEEVGRRDHAEVRLEEGLPRHRLAAFGSGIVGGRIEPRKTGPARSRDGDEPIRSPGDRASPGGDAELMTAIAR
jgi:hypothetical protein